MTTVEEKYLELIALSKLYLFQEHALAEWISTDAATFEHFKAHALKKRQPPQQALHPQNKVATLPSPRPAASQELPRQAAPPAQPLPKEGAAPAPPPPPKETEASNIPVGFTPKSFVLEPIQETPTTDYQELKRTFLEKFPQAVWLEEPSAEPTESEVAPAHSAPEVIVLSYQESGNHLEFLQNMTSAISRLLGPAEIVAAADIEREECWEEFLKSKPLRLIITSLSGAQSLPGLMKHFKEAPKQGRQYLGKVPVCLLADIAIYFKEPKLKQPLWQSIQALYHNGR